MLVNNDNMIPDVSLMQASGAISTPQVETSKNGTVEQKSANVAPTDDVAALNQMAKASNSVKNEQVQKSVQKVEELFMQYTNRELNFEEDKETGKMVIRIMDRDSGEVVRQIPPQQFLDMVANFAKLAEATMRDVPKFV